MLDDAVKIADNLKNILSISIYCLEQKKQHYIERGFIKYWAQVKSEYVWKTPAQITDETRDVLLEKLKKFYDYASEDRFVKYVEFRCHNKGVDGLPYKDAELAELRKLWDLLYDADTFRLVVSYDDKARAADNTIEERHGYRPEMNGREIKSQYHWGVSSEFSWNASVPFVKHFYDFVKPPFNVNYYVEPQDNPNNYGWRTRKVKDIVRFAKRKYGIKTIGELKKRALISTNNVWGKVVFGPVDAYLIGDAKNIWGDISNIDGNIHPNLRGDVSGLKGCITNLYGDATGVKLTLNEVLREPTSIQSLVEDAYCVNGFKLLSNEDNKTLMKVWNCLAHHTIGLKESERKMLDSPVKKTPPFTIDKWGRHYYKSDKPNRVIVVSINPADIMFAKDVNNCSTCFCLNSGNSRWELGMRCLIALDSVNPTLGVAFEINKDSIKKMNQFNGIKFKWYEPERAEFFQYNGEGIKPFYRYSGLWNGIKNKLAFLDNNDGIEPIYGHDGFDKGHSRQKTLAYLETFIKDGYRWYRGDNNDFPLVNNYHDFTEEDVKKKEWESDIENAKKKAQELLAYLKQVKGE